MTLEIQALINHRINQHIHYKIQKNYKKQLKE